MLRRISGTPSAVCQYRVRIRPKPPSKAVSVELPDTNTMPEPLMKLITGTGKAATSSRSSPSAAMLWAGEAVSSGCSAEVSSRSSWGWPITMVRYSPASSAASRMPPAAFLIRPRAPLFFSFPFCVKIKTRFLRSRPGLIPPRRESPSDIRSSRCSPRTGTFLSFRCPAGRICCIPSHRCSRPLCGRS